MAIVVYDSTVPPGTGKGVYMEARAYELTDSRECSHAFAYLRRRGWEHPASRRHGGWGNPARGL